MDISGLITQLSTEVTDLSGKVQFAATVQAGLSEMQAGDFPCAYIVGPSELPAENQLMNAVSQRVECTFGVLWLVRSTADMWGKDASSDLDSMREDGMAALIGWEPQTNYKPVEFSPRGGGRLVYAQDGILGWLDEFITEYYLRA